MNDLAERIVRYMKALSYKVAVGPKNYNIVYVEGMNVSGELNPDTPNCFNDRRLVIQSLNARPSIIGNWEGTTEPGNHYTQKPMNPRSRSPNRFWAVHGVGCREARNQRSSCCIGASG